MIEVCLRLGYQLEAIQRVITLNGRPFPKISELIDALYVAADGGDISSVSQLCSLCFITFWLAKLKICLYPY